MARYQSKQKVDFLTFRSDRAETDAAPVGPESWLTGQHRYHHLFYGITTWFLCKHANECYKFIEITINYYVPSLLSKITQRYVSI